MSILNKIGGLLMNSETPVKVELYHPVTRQPLVNAANGKPAYVSVLSMDSEAAKKLERATADRRFAQRVRKIRAEDIEADNLNMLVALTRGWELVTLDGAAIDLPHTDQHARELYALPQLRWLVEQINEAIGDRANFAPPTPTA